MTRRFLRPMNSRHEDDAIAVALHALDEDELDDAEARIASSRSATRSLDEYREVAALVGAYERDGTTARTEGERPRRCVRRPAAGGIDADTPFPVVTPFRARRAERKKVALGGLAVGLAAAFGGLVVWQGGNDSAPTEASAVLTGEAAGDIELSWTESDEVLTLRASDLPPVDDDDVYQLWLVMDDGVVSAGVFRPAASGVVERRVPGRGRRCFGLRRHDRARTERISRGHDRRRLRGRALGLARRRTAALDHGQHLCHGGRRAEGVHDPRRPEIALSPAVLARLHVERDVEPVERAAYRPHELEHRRHLTIVHLDGVDAGAEPGGAAHGPAGIASGAEPERDAGRAERTGLEPDPSAVKCGPMCSTSRPDQSASSSSAPSSRRSPRVTGSVCSPKRVSSPPESTPRPRPTMRRPTGEPVEGDRLPRQLRRSPAR